MLFLLAREYTTGLTVGASSRAEFVARDAIERAGVRVTFAIEMRLGM
jgi:hypothetical protein